MKKNATVLGHLLNWARNFGGAKTDGDGAPYVPDVPLLVIDDESDVGSVDTAAGAIDSFGGSNPDHNPSTINKQIRKLLTLFDQSSYIGSEQNKLQFTMSNLSSNIQNIESSRSSIEDADFAAALEISLLNFP